MLPSTCLRRWECPEENPRIVVKRFTLLSGVTGIVVLMAAIPLFFVVYSGFQLSPERWAGLWQTRLPDLLGNTLWLGLVVATGCFVLGVSSAWLIARREFAGRALAIWLMVLPLAIPTYVFAYIYTSLLADDGWLGQLWVALFGDVVEIPDIYSGWGAGFILTLAGFSYVFLLVRASLIQASLSMEEAARIQGASPMELFWRVQLPLLRPALAAGLAVVTLHTLSDFGAVSMLRYQTFTLSIYMQMEGRFDNQGAAGLSLVLVALSLTFLVLERFFRSRQRYFSNSRSRRFKARRAGGGELVLIWCWLGLIALFAFILPLIWVLHWSWQAWGAGLIDAEFWSYTRNSLLLGLIAATVTVVIGLPVALYHARIRSWLSECYLQLSSIGFVLPGPVVALGVITFVLAQMPLLYGGLIVLLMALVVRFLPLAVQSQEAALQQLTPSIEQAGRVLGAGPLENLWRVTLPLIRGGVVTAWVLVFIDVLKELPVTLILRPIGYDTLPVRIWIEASEEMLELAAPAALMLIIGTLPALWIMMRIERAR